MTVNILTEHDLEFLSLKEATQARLSLHMSKSALLEITYHGSYIFVTVVFVTLSDCSSCRTFS